MWKCMIAHRYFASDSTNNLFGWIIVRNRGIIPQFRLQVSGSWNMGQLPRLDEVNTYNIQTDRYRSCETDLRLKPVTYPINHQPVWGYRSTSRRKLAGLFFFSHEAILFGVNHPSSSASAVAAAEARVVEMGQSWSSQTMAQAEPGSAGFAEDPKRESLRDSGRRFWIYREYFSVKEGVFPQIHPWSDLRTPKDIVVPAHLETATSHGWSMVYHHIPKYWLDSHIPKLMIPLEVSQEKLVGLH